MTQYKMQFEVRNLINELKGIKEQHYAKRFVLLNEEYVTGLNKEQLLKGYDSNMNDINPHYANILYKNRLSPVDLHLTGKFYDSFFIYVTDNSFGIDAGDSKRNKLVKKYGINIFGLNEISLFELRKDLLIFIQNDLKKRLL